MKDEEIEREFEGWYDRKFFNPISYETKYRKHIARKAYLVARKKGIEELQACQRELDRTRRPLSWIEKCCVPE
jgi:hypothetical protein